MFKVFLVEDEIVVREGIRNNILWEQYGFQYAGDAPDGELALPLIRQIQPDLLITDIRMPFIDGLKLIELIRKDLPKMKIVIISGYDDFTYAQQALRLGVEQYLLKPISKVKLVQLLADLREKMENEKRQEEYLARFQQEVREYESFSRRRFFEQIVVGSLSVMEITEKAKSLGIDIHAPYYNIVLLSLNSAGYDRSIPESYTDAVAVIQDKISGFIDQRPEFLLFRWNISTYAVLVKGGQNDIRMRTEECIQGIQNYCADAGDDVNWYIAHGTPVPRLGAIPSCFAEANRILSYRYICSQEHILTEESISRSMQSSSSNRDTDKKEIEQEHIRAFLSNGTNEELDGFIDQLFQSYHEDRVSLTMFTKYLAMTVFFAVVKYMDSIGCSADSFWTMALQPNENGSTPEEAKQYIHKVMEQAIKLRDNESEKQQRNLLTQAIRYIDSHYSEESMSLDKVAGIVNISPNYFSAIFSQQVGQTFIEYLTNKRIEAAKRMLLQTDKRSSEIANAVGYRDPHYFSFVFKKVTGCTPNEYRRGNRK